MSVPLAEPLLAPVRELVVAPTWAPVRRAPALAGRQVMTLAQLWRALDAGEQPGPLRRSALCSEWHVDACLARLDTPLTATLGAARLAAGAVNALRMQPVSVAQLGNVVREAQTGEDALVLLSAYEATFGEDAARIDDHTAGTRAALAVAASPKWPAPWDQVQRIVFRHGHEWIGREVALVLALAASGREVIVEADAATQSAADPLAAASMAAPYEDAMVGPLEASGADTLEVRWLEPEEKGCGPDGVQVFEVAPGPEVIERVVFDVAQAIARGIRPEHIAIVLPPSAPPLWRRRAATRRLRTRLREAGIAHQGGSKPRLGDTYYGMVCLDALQLAYEWASREQAPAVSLAAWGRLLFALGDLPDAPSWWPHPSVDERIGIGSLGQRLTEQSPLPPDVRVVALAAAEQVLNRWVRPLVEQPLGSAWPHLLALFERAQEVAGASPAESQRPRESVLQILEELNQAWPRGPQQSLTHAAHLSFVRRALERSPLTIAGADGGVVLLRPHDLPGARFEAVFVVGVNEQVWFRPEGQNPWLPESLVRSLARARLAILTPAASVAGERALLPRDRSAWLWHHALRASGRQCVAYLLLDGQSDSPGEPACEAILGPERQPCLAPPVATEPVFAQIDARRARIAHAAQAPPEVVRRRALLSADSCLELEASVFGREQTASHVDELARCRFRYFAGVVLGLEERERPSPRPSPRLLGQAMHLALKHAVDAEAQRRHATQGTLPLTDEQCAEALVLAEAAFFIDAELYVPADKVHPHLLGATRSQVWAATREQLLQAWQGEPVRLRRCELAFGGRHALPALQLREPEGTRILRVRGAIDRIDVSEGMCTTLDYKNRVTRRIEHRHLQLPVYSLVAGRDVAPGHMLRAGWLALTGHESGRPKWAKELEGDFQALQQQVTRDAWARLSPLLQGDIEADPAPASSCRACSFGDVCHIRRDEDDLDSEEEQEE